MASTFKYVDTEDGLYKLQWDALWESIENNSYLKYTTNKLTNKSLNTTNKKIIKAINEVFEIAQNSKDKVDLFTERFNSVVGNELVDPTLLSELQEIDINFFKAIIKINKRLESVINGETEIQGINSEIQEILNGLNERIAILENKEYIADFEEINVPLDIENQRITLSHTPRTKESVSLFINGVYYPTSCFNMFEKALEWLVDDKDEDSFPLEEDFEVDVRYDYMK